jgi:hypothetical protein
MWKWLFGVPAVDGITENTPSAPELMIAMSKKLVEQDQKFDKVFGVLDELRTIAHRTNALAKSTNVQVTPILVTSFFVRHVETEITLKILVL